MADLQHNLPPMTPESRPSFQMVKIINRNTFPIFDRFDGVPFVFKPNESLSIPPDAAQHFFGWPGEPDLIRLYIAKRHGWNTPDDQKRDETGKMRWEKWVDAIELIPVHFDLVQRDANAPIPADAGDPEAELMSESSDLPMPMANDADTSTTKVGVRKREVGARKPPRRIDP